MTFFLIFFVIGLVNLFNPHWPTSSHLAAQLIAQLMIIIVMLFLVSWQISDSLKNLGMFWPPVGGILKATDRLAPRLANLTARLDSELSESELELARLLIKCQRDSGRLFPTFLSFLVAISFVLPDPGYRSIAQVVTNVFLVWSFWTQLHLTFILTALELATNRHNEVK